MSSFQETVKLAEQFRRAKNLSAVWEDERKTSQSALVEAIGPDDEFTWPTGPHTSTTATVVRATTLEYDWDAIREAVGDEVWEQITERTPSKALLEHAIALKLVDVETVAACTNDKPKSPYVKLTDKEN